MNDLFTIIGLRSTAAAGTDVTLYVSQAGGYRTSGSVRFFVPRARYGPITVAADTAAGSVQAPGTLSISLENSDGYLDAYLPGGASEQYWSGATVTVYSGGGDGDDVSTMTQEFVGYITPGSVTMAKGSAEVSFVVQDKRAVDNAPVATETWDQHAQYAAATADQSIGGVTIPVILGDWSSTDARAVKLPAVRLELDTGTYTYGYCNHATNTVKVWHRLERNEAWTDVTGACTVTATDGYFTFTVSGALSTFDEDKSELAVTCKGYPTQLSDANPVRLIQWVLQNFGGVVPNDDIYNNVGAVNNGVRGSFAYTYAELGGVSPDYYARAYVDSADTRVLELVGRIAFESLLIVGHDGGRYRIYSTLPVAANRVATFQPWDIVAGQIGSDFDPDGVYANVALVQHTPDPSNGGKPTGYYDTDVSVTSGPIEDARTAYGRDVVYTDTFRHIYTGIGTAVQRALFWRIGRQEIVEADVVGAPGSTAWTHGLGADAMFSTGRYDGVDVRMLKIVKNGAAGTVGFVGLALHGLLTSGVWADSSGNDAAGNPVTGSIWANASGEDGSGNAVTSMWV